MVVAVESAATRVTIASGSTGTVPSSSPALRTRVSPLAQRDQEARDEAHRSRHQRSKSSQVTASGILPCPADRA